MKITRIGVDIAKSVFHCCATDRHGHILWQAKLTRHEWLQVVCQKASPDTVFGLEACGGAHHWARQLQARGFRVLLIAAQFVKPYVKSNKNDHIDAAAIAEAMSRPGMRFVPVKSTEQQDTQALHRTRQLVKKHRNDKANQIRGLVMEYGLVAPQSIVRLRQAIGEWLEDAENGLSEAFRALLNELYQDLLRLLQRLDELTQAIKQQAQANPFAQQLLSVRGIGPISASALSYSLGNAQAFAKGRHFAASIGLVPRQHSTGGHNRLLAISKRGDGYLRQLLVHGGRSVLRHAATSDDPLSLWAHRLAQRKQANVTAVALANKLARIAWAVVHNNTHYRPALAASAG